MLQTICKPIKKTGDKCNFEKNCIRFIYVHAHI